MRKEVWIDIDGYDGVYQVSNIGRVRSKDHTYYRRNYGYQTIKGRILCQIKKPNGYRAVSLNKDGKRKNYYVHRLVATYFVKNPNPEDKTCVNHIDRNRSNNHYKNLEWCTFSENIQYSLPYRKKRQNCRHSKYGLGIYLKRGKFEVYLDHKYFGRFWDLEDAIKVRDEYLKEVDG